jgi:hypothetical protein
MYKIKQLKITLDTPLMEYMKTNEVIKRNTSKKGQRKYTPLKWYFFLCWKEAQAPDV